MAAIPTSGQVLADLLTGDAGRFAADPEVAGWGDLIKRIQNENLDGEVPTTKNRTGVTDAKSVEAGLMTEEEFINKWGINPRDYEDLPQASIQSGDTKIASGDVKKQDYDNLEEKYKKEYDEYMNPKDPLGVPIKLASADIGAAPIGTYKGGDQQIAVGPYQPDDQPGQAWENFLQQSGGKTPFNYEINLNDQGLESIGADATITGDKGGQWSVQGSYDFPTNQEVMGPFGGEETINTPGVISGGLQYTNPDRGWTGRINYNKRNMGMPPGAFGAEFGAQF